MSRKNRTTLNNCVPTSYVDCLYVTIPVLLSYQLFVSMFYVIGICEQSEL